MLIARSGDSQGFKEELDRITSEDLLLLEEDEEDEDEDMNEEESGEVKHPERDHKVSQGKTRIPKEGLEVKSREKIREEEGRREEEKEREAEAEAEAEASRKGAKNGKERRERKGRGRGAYQMSLLQVVAKHLGGESLLMLGRKLGEKGLRKTLLHTDVTNMNILMYAAEYQDGSSLLSLLSLLRHFGVFPSEIPSSPGQLDLLLASRSSLPATLLFKSIIAADSELRETFPMKVLHHQPLPIFTHLLSQGFFTFSPMIYETRDIFGWTLPLLVAAKYEHPVLLMLLSRLEPWQLDYAASAMTPSSLSLPLLLALRHPWSLLLSLLSSLRLSTILSSLFSSPRLADLCHPPLFTDFRLRTLMSAGRKASRLEHPTSLLLNLNQDPTEGREGSNELPSPLPRVSEEDKEFLQNIRRTSSSLALIHLYTLIAIKNSQEVKDPNLVEGYLKIESDFLDLLSLVAANNYNDAFLQWSRPTLSQLVSPNCMLPSRPDKTSEPALWTQERMVEAKETFKIFISLRVSSEALLSMEADLLDSVRKANVPKKENYPRVEKKLSIDTISLPLQEIKLQLSPTLERHQEEDRGEEKEGREEEERGKERETLAQEDQSEDGQHGKLLERAPEDPDRLFCASRSTREVEVALKKTKEFQEQVWDSESLF